MPKDASQTLPIVEPSKPDPKFRRILLHAYRVGLIVATLLLVHFGAADQHRSNQAEVDVPIDRIAQFLPNAVSMVPAKDRQGTFVLDENQRRIGWAVTTLPTCRDTVGFSGPTNVLVVTDDSQTIRGIAILASEDTIEHVAAIRQDGHFERQFIGLATPRLPQEQLDAVSGATLTSLAIIESITKITGGDPPNYRFPDQIDLDEIQTHLPSAASMQSDNVRPVYFRVFDHHEKTIGYAWRTSPLADHHIGYQGPTDVLVVMDEAEHVSAVAIRESYDNDPYVRYVREDYAFPEVVNGLNLPQLANLDLKEARIEGVSGATMTSQAAVQSIQIAAEKMQSASRPSKVSASHPKWNPTGKDIATLVLIVVILFVGFSHYRGKTWVKLSIAIAVIAYLGFFTGNILSLALLVGWAKYPNAWANSLGMAAVVMAAFLIPVFSKKQIYCNHICPHGAAQILILKGSRYRWKMSPNLRLALSAIPCLLLGVAVLMAFSWVDVNLASIEPFDAYVPTIAGWAAISIAIGGLIFSALVPMGYCRYGCPTGAVLDYLRFNAGSHRWSRRDTAATGLFLLALCCFAAG